MRHRIIEQLENMTGDWEIHIDDLCGELAMEITDRAERKIEVVEREVFDRALTLLDKAIKIMFATPSEALKLQSEWDAEVLSLRLSCLPLAKPAHSVEEK